MIIPHLDDVGCCRGSITAFDQLTRSGLVTSGSVMVPSPLFGEVVRLVESRPDLDTGVHLTLTSESASFRWGPVSQGSHTAELTEAAGFFWPTTEAVRLQAGSRAVEAELRAQVETALGAGIPVSHLDHHMGAAVAPEFVEVTARLAREYRLPMLLPADVGGYYADLHVGEADPALLGALRRQLAGEGLLIADDFRIGYVHQSEPCREVYERLILDAGPGVTFLSLHCSAPGDVEMVHPASAPWRIAEYKLFGDPEFAGWVNRQGIEIRDTRSSR